MTEEEIYEELEITYGKPPRTTSEKNMIWLKGVLEEHIIEGEFNEDVPKLENFADLVRWQLQKVDPHIGAVA